MDMHTLRLFAAAKSLHNLCPQRTQGTQFGNLQEEVRPHGEPKHNLPGRLVYRQTAFEQSTQVSHSRSQCIGRFLHIISPAPAVNVTAHKDSFESRCIFHCPLGTLSHITIQAGCILAVFAIGCEFSQRVSTDNTTDFRHVLSGGLKRPGKQGQHGQSRFPGIDIHGIFIKF